MFKILKFVPIYIIEEKWDRCVLSAFEIILWEVQTLMKINGNSINAVNAYIHAASETASKKSTERSQKRNVDTVEFSQAGKAAYGMTSATASKRADAARAARDPASPERIAALKASVGSGSYHVSSDKIASAILNG